MANRAKEYLKNWISYRTKRYLTFLLITIISLGVPFITIDGNHIFLLSFDHMQMHLLGVSFDMQELYLMPFILILMFLGIFFLTTVGGRIWCGWGCPKTIFRVIYRDFIETKLLGLRKNINNKQIEPDMSKPINKLKKTVAVLIWAVLALIASSNFLWYFVPPEDFFSYIQNIEEHTTMLIFGAVLFGFLMYDTIMLKEDFCVYVCPYSRVQSVMYDDDTVMAVYDPHRGGTIYNDEKEKLHKKPPKGEGECTGCESCVRVCPTHIDIRKGLQLECINCLECVDACTKVMGSLEKESLVQWSSDYEINTKNKTRYFRFRTLGYIAVLTLTLIGLIAMSTTKEYMLLNINKTTELYSIKKDNIVQNSYVFLFQNTDNKAHNYYFDIEDNDDITILRPKNPFKLSAGGKAKKIVILQTKKELVKDDRKDTPITISIKAYAVDEAKRIVVNRETVFVYPRYDLIEAKNKK